MISREKFTNILIHSNPVSSLVERMRNKPEKFTNEYNMNKNLTSFIGFVGFITAMYFLFTCNAGKPFGSYVGEFLLAFCCWPIYLAYVGISKNWCRKTSVGNLGIMVEESQLYF